YTLGAPDPRRPPSCRRLLENSAKLTLLPPGPPVAEVRFRIVDSNRRTALANTSSLTAEVSTQRASVLDQQSCLLRAFRPGYGAVLPQPVSFSIRPYGG